MYFVSACKHIAFIEKFFQNCVKDQVAVVAHDTYKDDAPVYSRVYHTKVKESHYVKSSFKYDWRNGNKGTFEISNDGLQLIFQALSFYTILKMIGIKIFDTKGNFNPDCLQQIELQIYELTGEQIEIKLLDKTIEK